MPPLVFPSKKDQQKQILQVPGAAAAVSQNLQVAGMSQQKLDPTLTTLAGAGSFNLHGQEG